MLIYKPYPHYSENTTITASVTTHPDIAVIKAIVDQLVNHTQYITSPYLRQDSRMLQEGDIFVAFSGDVYDGRAYISSAIQAGASVILAEASHLDAFYDEAKYLEQAKHSPMPPIIAIEHLKHALGWIANQFYQYPSHHINTIGVTGTNGKTTVVNWIAQLLEGLQGQPCAVLGTLGAGLYGHIQPTGLTTPQASQVQSVLLDAVKANASGVAIEATSIGLEEGRLNGVAFKVAAFTNLTQDHLDYHQTMHDYAIAKHRLFEIDSIDTAVINIDDATGHLWANDLIAFNSNHNNHIHPSVKRLNIIKTGFSEQADLRVIQLQILSNGTQALTLSYHHHIYNAILPAVGQFNVQNALVAIGCLLGLGYELTMIVPLLSQLQGVTGRMQCVSESPHYPLVIVDYAHTPDGLEQSLNALYPVAQARAGRLTVVFGCGGNRDTKKRSLMGTIAQEYADTVVITNDNPRNEDPALIAAQIGIAAPKARIILDRAIAIHHVITQAQPYDVVLIAGKGHETTQIIQGVALPFSDLEHARAALVKT